ncbi:MAG: hypothetical protein ACPG2Y_03400, partial [Acholeplasmataceae bacterium]
MSQAQDLADTPQDLADIIANIPQQADPADEALTRLIQGVMVQMNGLKRVIDGHEDDIVQQTNQIVNLEQDVAQREEYQQ